MQEIIGYCDGGARNNGKDNNVGGWGALLQFWVDGKIIAEKELNGGDYNTTNNKMELQACIELMKAIKDKTMPTTIYFDSKYCRDGLESWLDNWVKNGWRTAAKKPVKNVEQWKELYKLKNEFANLKLEWCKGHADNEGNNRVDQLANDYMDILEQKQWDDTQNIL